MAFWPAGRTPYRGGMGELIEIRPVEPERLWREVLGARVRALRNERGLTLVQLSSRAGIAPQYLSEIERGLKDPSSEIVAAIAGALDLTVLELTTLVVIDLRPPAPVGVPFGIAPIRNGLDVRNTLSLAA